MLSPVHVLLFLLAYQTMAQKHTGYTLSSAIFQYHYCIALVKLIVQFSKNKILVYAKCR